MAASWRRLALSFVLLMALLVIVAFGLSALGGLILLPQLGALGWVAVGLLLFLGLQLVLFRLFGLRSRADEEADAREERGDDGEPPRAEGESPQSEEGDWRAWRG